MARILIGNTKGPKGDTGATGAAATVNVNPDTVTLDYDQPAQVINTGTESAAVFRFLIPKGAPAAGALDSIAREYSPYATYAVGQFVVYNNVLWECIEEIDTPEEWDITKWRTTTITYVLKNEVISKAVDIVVPANGWVNYQQTVNVTGLIAAQNFLIGLADTATEEMRDAAADAIISVIGQSEGNITLKVNGIVPEVDIPMQIITLW